MRPYFSYCELKPCFVSTKWMIDIDHLSDSTCVLPKLPNSFINNSFPYQNLGFLLLEFTAFHLILSY